MERGMLRRKSVPLISSVQTLCTRITCKSDLYFFAVWSFTHLKLEDTDNLFSRGQMKAQVRNKIITSTKTQRQTSESTNRMLRKDHHWGTKWSIAGTHSKQIVTINFVARQCCSLLVLHLHVSIELWGSNIQETIHILFFFLPECTCTPSFFKCETLIIFDKKIFITRAAWRFYM